MYMRGPGVTVIRRSSSAFALRYTAGNKAAEFTSSRPSSSRLLRRLGLELEPRLCVKAVDAVEQRVSVNVKATPCNKWLESCCYLFATIPFSWITGSRKRSRPAPAQRRRLEHVPSIADARLFLSARLTALDCAARPYACRTASHQAANVREPEIDYGRDYESDRRFGFSWLSTPYQG